MRNQLRAARPYILGLLLLCLIVWLFDSSQLFQSCVSEGENRARDETLQNKISILVGEFWVYRRCLGMYVIERNAGIIALFTVILAISTILLWVVTNKAAEAAKAAAEHIPRVERAFVFFDDASSDNITDPKGQPIIIKYSYRNCGRTTAILSRIQIGAKYFESGFPEGDNFTFGDGKLPAPLILGPVKADFDNDVQLWITGEEYEKAKSGIGRIFFWGKLTYSDVFRNNHETDNHETALCSEWLFSQSRFVISNHYKLNYYT